MVNALVLLFAAYVIGATPTSFWVGRFLYGKDLRELGSGNLGATNAFRVLGWKAAFPVLVVDVLKGWLPVWWFPVLDDQSSALWALGYGAASIVGHVFSFWVGFRGGKGVATSAGVLTALAPLSVAAGFVAWLLVLGLTRMVSASSLVAAAAVPLSAMLTPGTQPALTGFMAFVALFIVWAHRSNVRRILRGEEPRVGRTRRVGVS